MQTPQPEILQLPIYPFLDKIANTLSQKKLLLLAAETGAGKTTLVPWKLLGHPDFSKAKLLLLEPRRLAARAAANRIAMLLGEKIGQTIGIRTRLETLVSKQTRLEVVTEGVLTRLLQEDPSLAGYGTVLFDEFHTRSLPGDLGLALAWDCRKLFRPDLQIAIFSATLPAHEIRHVFGEWPLLEIPGRSYPVAVVYLPAVSRQEKPWEAATRLALEALLAINQQGGGTVLCFLPGYREMLRTQTLLTAAQSNFKTPIYLLHGQMPANQQQALLDPATQRETRIILATNVAETSLTIPGVKAVVDIGLERRVRFSPRTGMDHWETMAISQASAEQRKGRAGRMGPGICFRWWHENQLREKYSAPEILEADLAPLVLETALWGSARPEQLLWLTPPPMAAVQQAQKLLQQLQLLNSEQHITPLGRQAVQLSLHPRLAKMVLASQQEDCLATAAVIAALLENDNLMASNDPDFRDQIISFQAWTKQQPAINSQATKKVWEDVCRILSFFGKPRIAADQLQLDPSASGRLLLSAFPDRAAKQTRRDDNLTSRWLLATGRGALLKGPLSQADYLVIADLDGGEQDARIFLAAPIERKDLESGLAGMPQEIWSLTWQGWKPKTRQELRLGALVLKEKIGLSATPEILQRAVLERLQKDGLGSLPWNKSNRQFLARLRFVEKWGGCKNWPACDEACLIRQSPDWLFPFGSWDGDIIFTEASLYSGLEHYLGWERRKTLNDLAPESLTLPSGSIKKIEYETHEIPVLSARLQEFFGCATTPEICHQPLLLDLLSPAGRTVQRTRDLNGFWDNSYLLVKKELMGRYPRHAWPDNPRAARPTARAKPKKHLP